MWRPDWLLYGPGFYFGGFPGMIVWLLFWIVAAAGIITLITRLARRSTEEAGKSEEPLDILKRRYAAGEIDRVEFEQKKKDLLAR